MQAPCSRTPIGSKRICGEHQHVTKVVILCLQSGLKGDIFCSWHEEGPSAGAGSSQPRHPNSGSSSFVLSAQQCSMASSLCIACGEDRHEEARQLHRCLRLRATGVMRDVPRGHFLGNKLIVVLSVEHVVLVKQIHDAREACLLEFSRHQLLHALASLLVALCHFDAEMRKRRVEAHSGMQAHVLIGIEELLVLSHTQLIHKLEGAEALCSGQKGHWMDANPHAAVHSGFLAKRLQE
mmetsp:Transcript_16723/g.39095  ORF Transcript_16723/g.39095 Transcript_16723/m.39095 type:complete len:237 (+) Transcript_16723:475-1185(+)